MDFVEINRDLKEKFNKPYEEFYNRRVIVWIDEAREFEDQIDSLTIENVKILKMSEYNKFSLKKTLIYDDVYSDYLVYCPLRFDNPEDNWIEDVFIYSEIYRADLVTVQIDNMDLMDSNLDIRDTVKKYKKFFNAKSRRESVRKFSKDINSSSRLELAIMAVLTGSEIKPDAIIREVLKAGLDKEDNDIYDKIENYMIEDSFWLLIEQGTGYIDENRSLFDLFKHITLTASCRSMNARIFDGLESFVSRSHEDFCFQFVENWIRDSYDREKFFEYANEVSDDINLYDNLLNNNLFDFDQNQIFPCVDEVILSKLMINIKDDIIDPQEIYETCDNRRVLAWFNKFSNYYEIIYYMGKIKEFYNNNQNAFHMGSSEDIWESYANYFYLMDTYYRKFHKFYQLSLEDPNLNLDDLAKYTLDRVEGIYENWFLDKFLSNWTSAASDYFEAYGRIPDLDQQVDFYKNHVAKVDSRVFVIISDAMRYEVARELYEDLGKDMQCQISIDNIEGTFPTITSFGMASLLPNNGLEVDIKNDLVKVLIDGESTDMPNREKILRKANVNSKLLKYEDFVKMKKAEQRSETKGMEVVYIYHDKIDRTSHSSETEVFNACDKTIDELKNLVKTLVSNLSAINIFITSDHGFLYNYKDWDEHNKVDNFVAESTLEYGRRYVITDSSDDAEYLMPIKCISDQKGFRAFTPKDNLRIKKRGGGINFVHGGVSPQEKMVPLIKYKHLRNDSKEYKKNKNIYDVKPVELNLLSKSRKIINSIFNLSFYQSEIISFNREASCFILYFEDENGFKISDEVKIIADRSSGDDQDRIFNAIFNLNPYNYDNRKTYYLIIKEEDNKLETKTIEFNIDIPYTNKKLDFFS
ncbi:BREX-1 system phosphatase PglZ type A [Peptoniphilus vaginalis]|uniref:BREX-1 system phosphatase PglZ type A n=1 Tax=Peptoniphilus vaginalis TaxID=1756987 RepID=UPI0023F909AE|nr:BREX-1 system phosphatase PglZ type A [Peptoniphilus vaginalis]